MWSIGVEISVLKKIDIFIWGFFIFILKMVEKKKKNSCVNESKPCSFTEWRYKVYGFLSQKNMINFKITYLGKYNCNKNNSLKDRYTIAVITDNTSF